MLQSWYGFDSIALTKARRAGRTPDEIKVCIGCEIDGRRVDTFPAVSHDLRNIKPVF
ncbi:MAG: adenylosuccinate synthetase [Acidobacteria bacterium]|nr:adenylosuccinate synthetase [Acidobacteriota bacterium]